MTRVMCAGCGTAIVGRYVQALGETWHPDCFVCAGCGRPIDVSGFARRDGRPYHPACYQAQFGTRCAVCGDYIEGPYVENFWGDTYCAEHQDAYPACYACGRPVCRRLTGGGVRYNDGRVLCRRCRARAVDAPERAEALLRDVQAHLARHGVDTQDVDVPLRLVSLSALMAGEDDPARARMRGRTETQIETRNGREVARRIQEVCALGGLPQELLLGVLAHELGHVWLFTQRVDDLPPALEEGLCNLFAYLLHAERAASSAMARYCVRLLEEDPHPVYGAGLRRALAWYRQAGLPAVLEAVVTQQRWAD
jgi:hypothetical protein